MKVIPFEADAKVLAVQHVGSRGAVVRGASLRGSDMWAVSAHARPRSAMCTRYQG